MADIMIRAIVLYGCSVICIVIINLFTLIVPYCSCFYACGHDSSDAKMMT